MTSSASSALSPEAQLLYAVARDEPDDVAMRRLLAGPLDWVRITALAHREQALGVLWKRLRPHVAQVPEAHAAQFAQLARVAEFHLAHLQHRFEESVVALAGAGIDVVLLKGAGLAYTAYPSFASRPMSDVDLLLRPNQDGPAQALLGGVGWDWRRDEESERFYAEHHHLPPLFDTRGGGASLELHTSLFIAGHPLRLTAGDMWAAARTIRVAGAAAFVPHPHHQLLHACLHFAWGHVMQSGAWRTFRDVAAIIRTGEVDWDAFIRMAEWSRGASCCFWTFELARTLGGVSSVPDPVMARLRPPMSRLVRQRLQRHLALMTLGAASSSPSVRLDRFIWESAVMPEYYGHGPVRPWVQEDRLVSGANAAVGGPRPNRVLAQLHKLGAYGRYLRTMLSR